MKPRVCILRTDGTNCDVETEHALTVSGADCRMVHVNELRSGERTLDEFQALVIPGGFTYGDDVASGRILSIELVSTLRDQLERFVDRGHPVLGICNGFQVLAQTGLLPLKTVGVGQVSLSANDSGRFECRWVDMKVEGGPCVFTRELQGRTVTMPVAHAEGRFTCAPEVLDDLESRGLIALRYVKDGRPTQDYPENPNGSVHAIAGVCDPTGLILGLMPHPERFVEPLQHPNGRRPDAPEALGLSLFKGLVEHAAA